MSDSLPQFKAAHDLIGDADMGSTSIRCRGRHSHAVAMRGPLGTPREVSTAGISFVPWRNMSTSDSLER